MSWSILVVEDDEDVSDGLVQVLTARGYRVEAVSDGQAALRWLEAHGRPSVIVLDLMMPIMDGQQFLETIAAISWLEKVPVVVLTAQPKLATGLGERVEAILYKPLPLRRFLDTIDDVCHGRHVQA